MISLLHLRGTPDELSFGSYTVRLASEARRKMGTLCWVWRRVLSILSPGVQQLTRHKRARERQDCQQLGPLSLALPIMMAV
jgi:hypothetical protein